jgi:hypothetical protein
MILICLHFLDDLYFKKNHAEKCIYHFLQENKQSIISFLLYQLYHQIVL